MKQNYIMPQKKLPVTTNLQEVTELTYGEPTKATTRADIRRNSANEAGILEAAETFSLLNDVMYTTEINEVRPLNSIEIDTLASELVTVRKAKDIVEGRESALKAFATEIINLNITMDGESAPFTSGYLVSPENGVKLSKEVSGGKLTVDVDMLENVLGKDQFHSVTNLIHNYRTITYPDGKTVEETTVTRELNEEALEKQLKLGNIGMEEIIKATTPGKVRSAFYVRSL